MTDPGGSATPLVRVQAAVVRVREAFVLHKFGKLAHEKYRSEASPALRGMLAAPDPKDGWVDFDLFIEAIALADRLFAAGDLRTAWDIGRFAASYNQGFWRALVMKRVGPVLIMRMGSMVWSRHYDSGKTVIEETGKNEIVLQILDFARPHRAHCLSVMGWMAGIMELGPRTDVRVEEVRCRLDGGAACSVRCKWEPA